MLFYLALIAFGGCAVVLRCLIFQKPKEAPFSLPRVMSIAMCLFAGIVSVYGFVKPMASVPGNIQQIEAEYQAAFGDTYLEKEDPSLRPVQFSIPEFFMGFKTTGYKSERNVCYYESKEGADRGTKLFYDVYYPANQQDGPYPVLIRMHGRGGDIGSGNYPMPNKYFAGKGYVVYEIQYGDYLEKQDDGYAGRDPEWGIDEMQAYIRKFIAFAKANNPYNADWNSVFVSGNSFGGMMGDALALSMGKDPAYDALGIQVKGLVPFYPSSKLASENPKENPVLLVNQNSPPCLMFMGTHDGYVDRNYAYLLQDVYQKAGNQKFAISAPAYAGHGSDGYFAGYYMQVHLYYMERFMAQYR